MIQQIKSVGSLTAPLPATLLHEAAEQLSPLLSVQLKQVLLTM